MKKLIRIVCIIFVFLSISTVAYSFSDNFETPYNDEYNYNDDFSHESQPHIPGPQKQMDVAKGVSLATVGIVILNALTNTSVFGSASFNGSFNPQASSFVQTGAGTSAGMASTVSATQGVSAATTSQTAATASGGGGIFNVIGDFFKRLFETLRDMLTDEGRSYASGHMTDILSDIDISDLTNK